MYRVTRRHEAKARAIAGAHWDAIDGKALTTLGIDRAILGQLEHELEGTVLVPGMPGYDKGRDSNPRFDTKPRIIVYCETFGDVRTCLKYAHRYRWWVTSRSGGHSTAGYSVNTGMVIDTSGLGYVAVDPAAKTARVGAGTRFGKLNADLEVFGLHVPGGGCQDVAVAGYMQGGGFGFTTRAFGIQCDCVIGITMMTYDGRVVVANERRNPDLFWAVRGGTGNQFGVLLEIEYRLFELVQAWGFALVWSRQDAAAALHEMQRAYTREGATRKLGYMATVGHAKKSSGEGFEPAVTMCGVFLGSREDGLQALSGMRAVGSPELRYDKIATYRQLDAELLDVLPGPGGAGTLEVKDSQYFATQLTVEQWAEIATFMFDRTPNPYNIAFIEPYGGAVDDRTRLSNAFVHRGVHLDFYIDSFWNASWDPPVDEKQARAFLAGITGIVRKHWNGHTYQNYPRRDTRNYRWEYWGDAFNTLLFVKHKYDPSGFFHYEQSITPYPEGPGITRSRLPSLFDDPHIDYEPGLPSLLP